MNSLQSMAGSLEWKTVISLFGKMPGKGPGLAALRGRIVFYTVERGGRCQWIEPALWKALLSLD